MAVSESGPKAEVSGKIGGGSGDPVGHNFEVMRRIAASSLLVNAFVNGR